MPCVQSDESVSIIGKHQKIITHSKHNALLATLRQWLSSWILIYAVCVVYLRAHVIKIVPNIANFGQQPMHWPGSFKQLSQQWFLSYFGIIKFS